MPKAAGNGPQLVVESRAEPPDGLGRSWSARRGDRLRLLCKRDVWFPAPACDVQLCQELDALREQCFGQLERRSDARQALLHRPLREADHPGALKPRDSLGHDRWRRHGRERLERGAEEFQLAARGPDRHSNDAVVADRNEAALPDERPSGDREVRR